MLTTEIYYRKPADGRHGRWWFEVIELGHLGQAIDRLVQRCCRDKQDAHRQAPLTLAYFKRKEADAA